MASRLNPRLLTAASVLLCLTGVDGRALDQLDFNVAGSDTALETSLKSASGLIAAKKAKQVTALDLFADARAEYGKLISALYAQGHYGPVIHVLIDGREAADIAPLDAPTTINHIVVTVDPGPAFRFSKASITPLANNTDLPTGFAIGQLAESGLIQEAVQSSVTAWREKGFAKTSVATQELVANHNASTLSAAITLNTGPKLRFGPLTVHGAQRMREDRVRAIAGLPVGETFSPTELARATERLRRTGVFSSATMSEDDGIIAPDLQGITADLVESRLHRYTFGAEVASQDGVKLTGSWLHRNLLGGGERLEITGEIAGIAGQSGGTDYSLGTTLDRPATITADTTLNLGATISQINDTDTTAKLANVSVGFTQYFRDTLTGHVAISYAAIQGTDAAGSYDYRSLDLPIGVIWDRRDNKTDPTKLFYIDTTVTPFYGFGDTDNGAQFKFDARVYKGLGVDSKVVFAARLQGGAVFGADILRTPRNDLFYSGGGGTVRGQPYQSLGVDVDDGGTTIHIGGNQFLAGSLEARVKVTEKFGVVGFVDMGMVGADGYGSNVQTGAGLGVRYDTGVGPVRLDLAMPVNGGGNGLQVYVGLGQAF
ncbi:MAG: autotransporter assembly complex family protein [bacterium]